MNSQPALLGNSPISEHKIPITKPLLPDYKELAAEMQDIVESGMLTKGNRLRVFEEMVAEHLGVRHAVAVSSCTSGLMLTYKALGLKGDIVVPSFTFMATVSALVWAGLRPVFADVDSGTTNLDTSTAEAAITPETTAIVAVHNSGNPAAIDDLQAIANRRGLRLIFDAAHGFGSLYQGRALGRQGDASVFSLSPTKLLVAGEGGIVATNNDSLAERVRLGREYGNSGAYDSAFAGINARLPEINALLGQFGLLNLESSARHRNHVAELYQKRLGRLPGLSFQEVRPGNRSSYKDFSIIVDADAFGLARDELAIALEAENIETRKYYDPPVHRQTAYRQYAPSADRLSRTDVLSSRILNLPIWSSMEDSIVTSICSAIERAHEFAADIRAALKRERASVR
ncbi:MAG TPA: DegT/DnrJ/EryC1/StrS family aminotransferase [Pyrinomonadaceae bacterium]|jgi:dTDP-4-amino-4,6-dideoxygalactose transaminase|nr:DegT/DnrJ/EryC1/StrS family aminotransferase [Pyrinomonadaceae bacterium]